MSEEEIVNQEDIEKKLTKQKNRRNIIIIILLILLFLLLIGFCTMLILYLVDKTEDREIDSIYIYDLDGVDWSDGEEIQVFYNDDFGSNKVAPYSSGTYGFMLQNTSEYTLEYTIQLAEVNEYDIALCYRLKRDGDYLVDDYVRADEFSCEGITIEANSTHYFELEWYWDGDVSDVNDTLAGTNQSIYTLTISLFAKAV